MAVVAHQRVGALQQPQDHVVSKVSKQVYR
jgi:hypothetical protein